MLFSAASIVVAASAFWISWVTYQTNRQLPNENKLFDEKVRSYRNVVRAINTAAATYIECGYDYYYLKKAAQLDLKDKIDDTLIKAYNLMEDTVHEQMLVLPNRYYNF